MEIDEVLKDNLIADAENIVSTELRPQTKAALRRAFEITVGHHYAKKATDEDIDLFARIYGELTEGNKNGELAFAYRAGATDMNKGRIQSIKK